MRPSAASVSNCQATGTGLIHITSTYPSSYPGAFPSYFDLTFTADPSAVPGSRTITCSTDSGPITISQETVGGQTYYPLTVYDATPVIGGIDPTDPDDNGAFYIQIYGTNFGGKNVGSVSVCAVSTGSCDDFTISYASQYSTWSDQQVNVQLTPNGTLAADLNYTVYVTSIGESGRGFVALQGQSTPQSGGAGLKICPTPINFRVNTSYSTSQPAGSTPPGNSLYTEYLWDSSSRRLADLQSCFVREWVSYPGGNPYTFPAPFPPIVQSNPYDGGGLSNYGAGSDGGAGDINSPWGGTQTPFQEPYFANSFTATQVFQYACPCRNSGAYTTFTNTFAITRAVSSNGNGTWNYVLTKTGSTATGSINPLP